MIGSKRDSKGGNRATEYCSVQKQNMNFYSAGNSSYIYANKKCVFQEDLDETERDSPEYEQVLNNLLSKSIKRDII